MAFLFRSQNPNNEGFLSKPIYVAPTPYGKFCLAKNDGVCETIARGEIWEPFLQPLYSKYLPADGVFVDVGANYGSQCIPLASRCKKIYAFEPQRFIYDCLIETIRLNNITNIEVFNSALSDNDTPLEMLQGPQSHLQYGTFQASSSWLKEEPSNGSIKCSTLDSFSLERVDFIKSDTQGFDLKVLIGAKETIKKCKPVIVFEFENHPLFGTKKIEDFRDLLVPLGYSIHPLNKEHHDFLAVPYPCLLPQNFV